MIDAQAVIIPLAQSLRFGGAWRQDLLLQHGKSDSKKQSWEKRDGPWFQ